MSSIHNLIERIASLFRSSLRDVASAHGLKLVQLEALVYLSQANRYSDTPAAVADYLGVTKGTVSQTIKALADRGLLNKLPDADDGRSVHCRVTAAAAEIVQQAYPAPMLRGVADNLQGDTAAALYSLLRSLQQANAMRTFGQCQSCRFFQPEGQAGRCGLTQDALSRADKAKLCREHEPAHDATVGPGG